MTGNGWFQIFLYFVVVLLVTKPMGVIVEIGKQLLITRGSLTTFSVANDVAKCFAIIPAMFVSTFPLLGRVECDELSDVGIGDSIRCDL
jgi:high-affinity K+ transport system ATPase subunit B